MRTLLISSIALFFAFFTTPAEAQTKADASKNNYVVLTRNLQQLQPIILSAEALAEEDGKKFGDFKAIICGKTVKELGKNETTQAFIEKAEKANVEIHVCGFSLKKFGVDRNALPKELKIAENGILFNLQLQKQGYFSIEL